MESRARLFGHSIHQMLVGFPIGLLLTSVVFDALSFRIAGPSMLAASYWMLTAGIVGGLVAAPFGLIDLMAVPEGTRASRIGRWHGVGNVVVLGFFLSSWALRPGGDVAPSTLALALSVAGAALVLMTAWMGGELVSRLGIGVSPSAHPDARSSMVAQSVPPVEEKPGRSTL